MLNWGVDFRGGSEILIEFSRAVDVGDVRKTLGESGFHDAEVVKYEDPTGQKKWNYMVRVGAVSVVSEQQAKQIRESLAKVGDASLKRFEWSEGGDKIYLRYDRAVEPAVLGELAQGHRRQHDPGPALRARRRAHLRGDAGRPRHRDPAGPRHAPGRGRGGRDSAGRVGRRQGGQAAAGRRRPSRCSTRSCSSWCTSRSGSTCATARARSSRCCTTP